MNPYLYFQDSVEAKIKNSYTLNFILGGALIGIVVQGINCIYVMKLFNDKHQRNDSQAVSTDSALFNRRIINISPNHSSGVYETDNVNL